MSNEPSQEFESLGALPETRTWGNPDPPAVPLQPGARPLPEYELASLLGEGGFGQVWRAKGPGGFEVALKFVKLGGAAGTTELQALEMMKGIRHPHLLAVFGVWLKDGWLIVAMELADRSLLDRLREAVDQGHAGIPRAELLEYMREAAKGLDHLGSLNILHRDVKPHNLFLSGGGVKVADYGLARVLEQTMATVSVKMTPAYAAPELLDGKASVTADQYSLAVTYCHLRGGRLPFPGSLLEMLAGHAAKPPDLSMVSPAERPALERALAKQPSQRFGSCKEFVESLAASGGTDMPAPALGKDSAPTQVIGASQPTTVTEPRRRRTLWPWLAVPAVLVVVLALWLSGFRPFRAALPPDQPPERPADPEAVVVNSLGMRLVLIPPGEGLRGSPATETGRGDDEQQRLVRITQPFRMSAHEVTRGQFRRFVQATGYQTQGEKRGRGNTWLKPGFDQGDDHPVLCVSWNDAMEFCRWLGSTDRRTYRLPTEDEWEYACRAGTATVFHHGTALSARQANMDGQRPYGGADKGPARRQTLPVGQFPPNPWGLHDMHGNVWEWCLDAIQEPAPKPVGLRDLPDQEPPPMIEKRYSRGGSWDSPGWACRAAIRNKSLPDYGRNDLGFRVVLAAP